MFNEHLCYYSVSNGQALTKGINIVLPSELDDYQKSDHFSMCVGADEHVGEMWTQFKAFVSTREKYYNSMPLKRRRLK